MKLPALIVFCVMSFTAFGQPDLNNEEYRPTGSFGVHVDQDFLAGWIKGANWDRNYTQGTAFSHTRLFQEEYNFVFVPINLFYRLTDFVMTKNKEARVTLPSSLAFGVTAFTPRELRPHYPVYGDRPFSSVLFLETKRAQMIGRNYHSWAFTYAVLGTNVGYDFQSWVHRYPVQSRGVPNGWQTQISQGGSFAWLVQNSMRLPLRRKKYDCSRDLPLNPTPENLSSGPTAIKFGWDASYGTDAAMGYYTYFGGHIGGRIGWINFSNFISNKSGSLSSGDKRNSKDDLPTGLPDFAKRSNEYFLYFSMSPRLWGNNNLIQGQPHRPSIYALDSKYLSSFVAEVEVGLAATSTVYGIFGDGSTVIDKFFQVSYSIKYRTPEYKYPGFRRAHIWACLNLVIPIDGRTEKVQL